MANIKLKDLLKEMRVAGGVVSHNPWLKKEYDTPQINVKELVDSILKKAHLLVPHKNNFWYYRVKVYGPEHKEEKR